MAEREDLAEAWDGWGRSATLIAVGLAAVSARYFEWIDDTPFATGLIVTFWLTAPVLVVVAAWGRLKTGPRRALAMSVALASIVTALWVPWIVFGPEGTIASGVLQSSKETWSGPALDKPRQYRIELKAKPRGSRASVQLRLGDGPGAKVYKGQVTLAQMSKRRAEKVGADKYVLGWRLTDEVKGRQFPVTVVEDPKEPLSWPVTVTLRRRLPDWPVFAAVGVVLLLLGAALDVRSTRLRPTYLATVGATAGATGPMFATLFRADAATRSTFFAIFLALLVGAVAAALVVTLGRRLRPANVQSPKTARPD